MTRKEELEKRAFALRERHNTQTNDILLALQQVEREVWEQAAKIAETEGVYPELNACLGGPAWYQHGKRIAVKLRQQQAGI